MKKAIAVAGIVASLLGLFGCDGSRKPEPPVSDQFAAGQVWQYKTRASEPESRIFIGKVERLEGDVVVHIKIVALKIKNPSAPGGLSTTLFHAPISEAKLKESVTVLTRDKADLARFQEGYQTWLAALRAAKGGVFAITVKEIVTFMEQAINEGTKTQ
jgi:hypothetical protein